MTSPTRHTWSIEAREIERHLARRGRRHGFEHLEGPSTALVVVDLTPFFVESLPTARGVSETVDELAAEVRRRSGHVIWTVPAFVDPSPARREFLGDEIAERYGAADATGPLRERLWPGFDVDDRDLVVEKLRPSAFLPGSAVMPDGGSLHGHLAERGIDTVVVCGTVANVCVEGTVRDASALDLRPILVADATAAVTDDMLNATLRTVYRSFGDVRSAAEIVDLLG